MQPLIILIVTIVYLVDVIVYALDTTWELHKPYLQKSSLLSALLKKAEMTGMRDIEEEKEEDEALSPGEIGLYSLKMISQCVAFSVIKTERFIEGLTK